MFTDDDESNSNSFAALADETFGRDMEPAIIRALGPVPPRR
jgi:hypothetical protein